MNKKNKKRKLAKIYKKMLAKILKMRTFPPSWTDEPVVGYLSRKDFPQSRMDVIVALEEMEVVKIDIKTIPGEGDGEDIEMVLARPMKEVA